MNSEQKLAEALRWALEWIDALPEDLQLPAMPGFDRDYVNDLLARSPLPREQQPGLEWRKSGKAYGFHLFYNNRRIGEFHQAMVSGGYWPEFLGQGLGRHATEAEARQALWEAATERLKGTIKQDLRVQTQAGSSDSAVEVADG